MLRLLARPPVRGLLTIAFLARTTSAVLPITLLLALAQSHGYTRAASSPAATPSSSLSAPRCAAVSWTGSAPTGCSP
ncbi:hypothetical protein OHA63_00095 [Streptomyces anulatus]|uniref:hypothetical protein n=1 Tax=Streptomyces anulatus TaxID=1892 RepID=UPI002E2F179B|nr:hypothetical protein [Streptomyces anulatus]